MCHETATWPQMAQYGSLWCHLAPRSVIKVVPFCGTYFVVVFQRDGRIFNNQIKTLLATFNHKIIFFNFAESH